MEYVLSRLDLKLVLVVQKARNQLSATVHSESLLLGRVQQNLLPPVGAIPSGNHCSSLLTFVLLITIELVTTVCIVDFNSFPQSFLFLGHRSKFKKTRCCVNGLNEISL